MALQAKFYYLQYHAHMMVKAAVRHGDLIRPDCCSACGEPSGLIEAHHHDYSAPLDVTWLCRSCHLKTHGKKGKVHARVFNATQIVQRHLAENPQDAEREARDLAAFLGVGKSTVNNVQRQMRSNGNGQNHIQ